MAKNKPVIILGRGKPGEIGIFSFEDKKFNVISPFYKLLKNSKFEIIKMQLIV